MNIISKCAAMKIHRQHPDSRLARYCRGKYKWLGHSHHYLGREVTECSAILAVYVERRHDSHGPYACLMSVILN